MSVTMETRAKKYQLEIVIDAATDVVWRALVDEMDAWWLPDFHMLGEGSVVTFDATAGGHLIERKEDGGSLLWYTVSMCTPGESLHLVGHLAPAFGGPATTMLHLALAERDGATVLSVEDALFGHFSDETVTSLEAGWGQLFGDGLKRHVEE